MIALAVVSLFVGKYPLSLQMLAEGDPMQWKVFVTLRMSRTLVGIIGGFALGTAGFIYQTVFRNPLASPDIIGVSSGASAGAAAGILFLSGAAAITLSAFAGALLAVIFALALSALDRSGKNSTIVLAGIAVHAVQDGRHEGHGMVLLQPADVNNVVNGFLLRTLDKSAGVDNYNVCLCLLGGDLIACVKKMLEHYLCVAKIL